MESEFLEMRSRKIIIYYNVRFILIYNWPKLELELFMII